MIDNTELNPRFYRIDDDEDELLIVSPKNVVSPKNENKLLTRNPSAVTFEEKTKYSIIKNKIDHVGQKVSALKRKVSPVFIFTFLNMYDSAKFFCISFINSYGGQTIQSFCIDCLGSRFVCILLVHMLINSGSAVTYLGTLFILSRLYDSISSGVKSSCKKIQSCCRRLQLFCRKVKPSSEMVSLSQGKNFRKCLPPSEPSVKDKTKKDEGQPFILGKAFTGKGYTEEERFWIIEGWRVRKVSMSPRHYLLLREERKANLRPMGSTL